MSDWSDAAGHAFTLALEDLADPALAAPMAAYMRNRFVFHGIKSPQVTTVWKAVKSDVDGVHGRPTADDLLDFADAMWDRPEREHQYVAAKAMAAAANRKDVGGFESRHLDRVRHLIVTQAWWDTVDVLAPNVVGRIAHAHPDDTLPVLERWLVDDDLWLVRSALLHQLKWKADTDRDRLSRYCLVAAGHPDFFVRKAIGWALRQFSYIDAPWVEAFAIEHADVLSGLSCREATKAINRERARASR
jgi:3-methyladenine DNA glycosylase AlkD